MKKIIRKDFLFSILVWLMIFMPVEAEATELKEVKDVKLQLTTEADGFSREELMNSLSILSEGVVSPTKEQTPSGWFAVFEKETNAWTEVLEAGKTYRLTIYLLPEEGYKWPANVGGFFKCTMNNSGQGVWSNDYEVSCGLVGEYLLITVGNFRVDQWIESVEFSLPDYKVGNEGNFKMVTTTTEGVIADTGIVMAGEFIITEQGFQPHTEYRVQVAFVADKGYSLAKLQKHNIKVMGKEPKEFSVLINGAYFVETDLDILHDGGVANCHTPKICDICQEPYGEKDLENHHGETGIRNVVQATCIQSGYTGDAYCLSCESTISSGTETPLSEEHAYDEGVITISPTEISVGIKTYTCTLCQVTKTEEIPKLENNDGSQDDGTQDDGTQDDGTQGDDGSQDDGSQDDGNQNEESKDDETQNDETKDNESKGEDSKVDVSKGDSNKENSNQVNVNKETVIPAKNDIITDLKTGIKYRVTKAGKKGGTVEFFAPKNKKQKQITIPDTVKIGGITYKVTSIAKNAFKGCKKLNKVVIGKNINKIGSKAFYECKKLKTIIFKTTKLKSSKVGKKAFAGTAKKAKVTVSRKSYSKYKKFLHKKGINKQAKIKKAKK